MTNETPKKPGIFSRIKQLFCRVRKAPKAKRDLFRFNGEKPTAINLEHVTGITVEGKRITFEFYSNSKYIDMADEAAALSAFEVMLGAWAGQLSV